MHAPADELIARFDAAVPDQWEPHAAPTPESVAAIEGHFGCRLPGLLLEFATRSRSFSSVFLGLGPDFDEYTNILARNASVRTDPHWLRQTGGIPAPAHLVFITNNFMSDHFWCLDARQSPGVLPIVFWDPVSPAPLGHDDFDAFVRDLVDYHEGTRRR